MFSLICLLNYFPAVLYSLQCINLSPFWLIPKCFILSDASVNGIKKKISFSGCCLCIDMQLIFVDFLSCYFAEFIY